MGMLIDRPSYISKILPYLNTPFIKIFTGIRRCGKSYVLKLLQEKLITDYGIDAGHIVSYRFDSMEYDGMDATALYKELKGMLKSCSKTYLFLDEIQEISGWEKVVNSIASDYNADIYITGSNSRMMSSELETYLTGRYVLFRIFTLSFSEYLTFKKGHCQLDSIDKEFINYVRQGGFPAVHVQEFSDDAIYTIVRDIYNSTIYSDIVRRSQIRKVDQLERVVRFVFDNVGSTFSAKSISDYLKAEHRAIDNETVYGYLDKLERAYILHRCPRYDIKGKELLKTQEKFYLADTSLRYSVLGYNQDDFASSLENVVYLELCRRGYSVAVGKNAVQEIDFVGTKQNQKIYVQVAEKFSSEETVKREYQGLLAIKDNYPKFVLCLDDSAGGNYAGIQTMNIVDFLLDEK